MIYLSGSKNSDHEHHYRDGTIGLLKTPNTGYRVNDVKVWALDNGCFTDCYPGDEAYLDLLDNLSHSRDRCLFVAAPDVVGDASATLVSFHRMAHRIRAKGWPVALVLQDGMENLSIPWDKLDWVFVGGSTEWKLGPGAQRLVAEAKARGKMAHMGRVNSLRRLRYATMIGCDTADGTALAFNPSARLAEVLSWGRAVNDQHML